MQQRRSTASLVLAAALALAGAAHAATPAVSSSSIYALGLSQNGNVFSWGWDLTGALGQGRPLYRASAQKVPGMPTVTHMDAGANHVAIVSATGHVWMWGRDNFGQMGKRTSPRWSKPARLVGVGGAVQVAAGESFTAIRRNDDTVLALGRYVGEPGVPRFVLGLTGVTDIRARGYHLLARKSDGTVWAVGRNEVGQLGDGTTTDRVAAQPVPGLSNITRIATSRFGSVALRGDGTVFRWGQQCTGTQLTPLAVTLPTNDIVDVASSNTVIYAIRSTPGQVYLLTGACNTPATALANVTQLSADVETLVARRNDGTVIVTGANAEGQHGAGTTTPILVQTIVPGLANIDSVSTAAGFVTGQAALFALDTAGDLFAWGSNAEGKLGLDEDFLAPIPQRVFGLPEIVKVAAGPRTAAAIDVNGEVWAWGNNFADMFNSGTPTPSSTPVKIGGATGVTDVAVGQTFLMIVQGGFVRARGVLLGVTYNGSQLPGLSGITKIAATISNAYAIDGLGNVHAWGSNAQGLVGDGTLTDRTAPVQLTAFNSPVTAISANEFHALALTADGGVWSWGTNLPALGDPAFAQPYRSTPTRVAGVAGAIAIAAGKTHSLALLGSGQVVSWGGAALGDGPANLVRSVPGPVRTISGVRSIAASYHASFAVGPDGLTYGWGGPRTDTLAMPTGDGTFAFRGAPALVLREGAQGNLDGGNWFLDLDPTVANAPPAAVLRAIIPVASAAVSEEALSLSASINFRTADIGRRVKTFILGVVPTEFVAQMQVSSPLGEGHLKAVMKAGDPVLVQLTPNGWSTVNGQLVAYASGVVAGNGGAVNILNGVPLVSIPGATFCIGYGESADSMLSTAAVVDVLTLQGATSTASGMPCVVNGVYVDGPASSIAGSPVAFNASVVGFGPTGSVQFKNNAANLGGSAGLAATSSVVSRASIATSSLGAGPHSIGVAYSGDGSNAAMDTAYPLAHTVSAAAPGSASVALSGAASSESGTEAVFTAVVTGNNPTGTVQFKDGAADIGAAEALVGATATLRTSALAPGPHSITAVYGGDTGNTGATSSAIAHTVYASINTSVALASNANPAAYGAPVTLTATVSGTNPTGSVTFQEGATTLATVALSGTTASTTVGGLAAGVHVLTATYSGDGSNQAVTSPALNQLVNAQAANTAPTPFAFAPLANAPPGSTATSNPITVSGLGTTTSITVTAGSYSIGCTATFTTAAATIGNGQTVCVRHAASAANGTATYTTLTIGGVSATFTSTTYAATFLANVSATVTHYYQSILGRAPDAGGAAYWQGEALRVSGLGASVNEAFFSMAATFYVSAEYAAFNRNNTGFATDLYNTFFNRAPDSGGLAFWVGQLDSGLPREVALAAFMFSAEFASYTQALFGSTAARAEVNTVMDFYRGLLARLPDDGGLAFWVGRFRAAQCQGQAAVVAEVEAISSAFALSAEYTARNRTVAQYVGDLYNAFLRRGGDLGGVNFWIGQVNSGAQTREQVRVQFKNSAEFQARVNAIIAQGCL